jgi:hypothetical protein
MWLPEPELASDRLGISPGSRAWPSRCSRRVAAIFVCPPGWFGTGITALANRVGRRSVPHSDDCSRHGQAKNHMIWWCWSARHH